MTDLVAAESRTSAPLRQWSLMYSYQSSRKAKSFAPSSSSLQMSARTNRRTGSVDAEKPQVERGQP